MVEVVSLTYATFLCQQCADKHKLLGSSVSHLKPIKADFWSKQQLDFLGMGGNYKFIVLMKDYQLDKEEDIAFKYRTAAVDYYKRQL